MLFSDFDTWVYNLLLFLFSFVELVILKNFEISLTSLGNLARMGRDSFLMLASLLIFGIYLKATFCLKELLFLLAKSKSHPKL